MLTQDDNCSFFLWENEVNGNIVANLQTEIYDLQQQNMRLNIDYEKLKVDNKWLREKNVVLEEAKVEIVHQIVEARNNENFLVKIGIMLSFCLVIFSFIMLAI